MSNAISLIFFFLKKSVFPSMKTLFEIKSYAGPDVPGVRLFCVSSFNLHTTVGGGEMGNQPRDGGCNHMNSATYDPKCATPIFSEICCIEYANRDLLRNHSCDSKEQWFTRYGKRAEWWKLST